jgi:preprotein translocase subunit SecG
LLVLVVLMQLPRSEGLGAAFGGGVTENIFGAQTTHVLAKFTVWLGVAFFVLTLLLAIAYSHQNKGQESAIQRELRAAAAASAPAALPTATPAAAASPVASPSAVVPAAEATPGATTPSVTEPVATPAAQPEAAATAAPAPSATP